MDISVIIYAKFSENVYETTLTLKLKLIYFIAIYLLKSIISGNILGDFGFSTKNRYLYRYNDVSLVQI